MAFYIAAQTVAAKASKLKALPTRWQFAFQSSQTLVSMRNKNFKGEGGTVCESCPSECLPRLRTKLSHTYAEPSLTRIYVEL